jgi:hypothetical protein
MRVGPTANIGDTGTRVAAACVPEMPRTPHLWVTLCLHVTGMSYPLGALGNDG